MLESFVGDKHSSLFCQFISGKEQMLQNFLLPLFTIGPNKLKCLSLASIMFVRVKPGAYPRMVCLRGATLEKALVLSTNIKPRWKGFPRKKL